MESRFESLHRVLQKTWRNHPKIIQELSRILSLPYQGEKKSDSNVCLIESEEIRPEFREVFTSTDVSYYIYSIKRGSSFNGFIEKDLPIDFPYPQNSEAFWKAVMDGKNLVERPE
ncbi:MAG TPA: hypothetical protein DGG95_00805 [Cytophagales bacterium]|nr:hypothetical protein [Cytophagales bacterium]